MKKFDVIVAGYLCIDLIPNFKSDNSVTNLSHLLVPGRLIEIEGLNYCLGGTVANTGLALKKFNKRVFLNGLIGNDFIGKIILDRFVSYELSEGINITEQAGTALCIVLAPPGIDRIFLESPGCSMVFDTSHINYDAISQTQIFHFGYPPLLKQFYQNNGFQLHTLFSNVHEMGVVTSLDFSLPDQEAESGKVNWPIILKSTLPFTDIFTPSLEEALQIMMPTTYAYLKSTSGNAEFIDRVTIDLIRLLGKKIIDCGVKILLLKMGHRGVYLLTGDISSINVKLDSKLSIDDWNNCEFWCKAYKADELRFRNAAGAGDTAIAAFLAAILEGKSPKASLMYAAIAGRNKLYCHDIYSELDDWQTMGRQIVEEQVEINSFHLYPIKSI